jgi:hypothetical protein
LVICDDFRRTALHPAADQTIAQFRRGWRINTLLTAEELQALARDAGFEHQQTIDLTAFVEIRRLRDRVASGLLALLRPFSLVNTRFDYLVGGSALQKALANRWIGYDLAWFHRV